MLALRQTQRLEQKLSPQQIQYQKLLQLNTLALEQRLKTELEINPLLEGDLEIREEREDDEKEIVEGPETESEGESEDLTESKEEVEFSVEDYLNDDEYFQDPSYQSKQENDETKMTPIAPAKESLSEHLLNQLYLLDIDENLTILGEEIIGYLDDDGYLRQDMNLILQELEMFQHINISPTDADALLKVIQIFDPIGIASRSLQECLLIQLEHSSYDPYYTFLAEKMLTEHFDDFVHKRYDILRQKMQFSQETLRSILTLIQSLNPKPGEGNIASEEMNQITPDFIVEKEGNDYTITLNDRSLPSITINRTYLEMLKKNKGKRKLLPEEKKTYVFLKEKFESARWFIACIEQRRETLLKVMRTILEKQFEFFDKGPKCLHPMIYKDIADEIMMDISTISRVVNGKFVQSPQGIHELKYFFSEGLATDSGEEVANKHIKELIREIIEKEGKRAPLSDDKLAEMLNAEGIHIARRTVAKYREQMRIPVARLRKGI